MVIFHIVLREYAAIDHLLFREKIHGIAFLHEGVALVLFVGQDAANRALVPYFFLARCKNAHSGQTLGDRVRRESLKEEVIDQAHGFCLLLVDDHLSVFAPVVAKEMVEWHRNLTIRHALALAPGTVFRNAAGFFLRKAGHDGNEQFSLPVKGPDVFLFKEAFHAFLLQVADGRQAVHGVAGKAANRLGDDQINLSVQRVLHHLLEAFAVLDACAGNTFIGVYAAELPIGVAFDEVCVVVHLRLIAGQLFLAVGGDPGVSGDAPFAGSRYGHRGIAGQRGGDFRYLWHFCFAHLSSIICRLRSRASGVQHS